MGAGFELLSPDAGKLAPVAFTLRVCQVADRSSLRASPIMLCKPAADLALSRENIISAPAGQHNRTDNMNWEEIRGWT
jgi:hypothetical protein